LGRDWVLLEGAGLLAGADRSSVVAWLGVGAAWILIAHGPTIQARSASEWILEWPIVHALARRASIENGGAFVASHQQSWWFTEVNEIIAISQLLEVLKLYGAMVSLNAMGC